jgi:hypothetical protein
MTNNAYHFITHWRVSSTVDQVSKLLGDVERLPEWWPSVYIDVKVLEAGASNGIGKRVMLYTKGWLPYTLRWQFLVSQASATQYTLQANGDFVGRGIWTFAQNESWVEITYDWQIAAEKPLLRLLSPLLKPLFSMNHHWAMQQGETSLKLELERIATGVAQDLPPPATPSHLIPWLLFVFRYGMGNKTASHAAQ